MSWETNRLLEKKHCPLFRQRFQPLIHYYKLLTSMVISFQSNRITVQKFLHAPEEDTPESIYAPKDLAIDSRCFQNVCKRLGCQHCYENFTDEEFTQAASLLRKESRRRGRAPQRKKGPPQNKIEVDAKVK